MITVLALCISVLLVAPDSTPGIPPRPLLDRARAYLEALNSGDSRRMEEALRTHFAPKALAAVPIQERLKRTAEMRERLGAVSLERVIEESVSSLSAVVTSTRGGPMQFEFLAEPDPPHRLMGIRITPLEDEADAAPVPPAPDAQSWVRDARFLMDSLKTADAFSGVVLLARRDSILLLEARGQADRKEDRPNTPDTRFNIGSISKVFTHIAIHQLETQGRLSLHDTLASVLPSYPNPSVARSVTIRHLLEMTSGIPDFFNERFAATPKERLTSLGAYLPLIADLPLEFEPGSRRKYSNGGYLVLGLVIEAVAGTDYYSYVRDHVYGPAGMLDSGSPSTAERDERYAVGYTGRERVANYETLPGRGSSAGGGYSTVRDLFRFVKALEGGALSHPSAAEGLRVAGGAPGLNAALEWDRARGYIVIVLANLDPPAAERLARRLFRAAPGG